MTTLPNPRRRLWRTWLKWPRDVRVFAPRIDDREVLSSVPEPAEVAHWSEVILLEVIVIALHGDGTTTRLTHFVTMPYGDENLAAWDDLNWAYDERDTRLSLQRAAVYSPDGKQYNAARQVLPLGAHNRLLKLNFTPLRRGTVVCSKGDH